MPDSSSTRRSFFGLSAGAALLCTIGGEAVRLDDPDAARTADAMAARVKRPPGAAPQDALTRATRRRSRPRRPGRRAARDRDGRRVPRLPHPRTPLEGRRGRLRRHPDGGADETITARFVEDNPGRWPYHCHVFSHQDAGMAGWYMVSP